MRQKNLVQDPNYSMNRRERIELQDNSDEAASKQRTFVSPIGNKRPTQSETNIGIKPSYRSGYSSIHSDRFRRQDETELIEKEVTSKVSNYDLTFTEQTPLLQLDLPENVRQSGVSGDTSVLVSPKSGAAKLPMPRHPHPSPHPQAHLSAVVPEQPENLSRSTPEPP
jgi:hypothetical protein